MVQLSIGYALHLPLSLYLYFPITFDLSHFLQNRFVFTFKKFKSSSCNFMISLTEILLGFASPSGCLFLLLFIFSFHLLVLNLCPFLSSRFTLERLEIVLRWRVQQGWLINFLTALKFFERTRGFELVCPPLHFKSGLMIKF